MLRLHVWTHTPLLIPDTHTQDLQPNWVATHPGSRALLGLCWLGAPLGHPPPITTDHSWITGQGVWRGRSRGEELATQPHPSHCNLQWGPWAEDPHWAPMMAAEGFDELLVGRQLKPSFL